MINILRKKHQYDETIWPRKNLGSTRPSFEAGIYFVRYKKIRHQFYYDVKIHHPP